MLSEVLKNKHIILASGSPRRQDFFRELGIDFTIDLKPVDEIFPEDLKGEEIADFLARLKAAAFSGLKPNEILITSDTIVWHKGEALGKPVSAEDAFKMLNELSGKSHEVITSVCFTTAKRQVVANETTTVWFREFTDEELHFYIEKFKPFDKAGAYGIQEWIGIVGVERIEGSYSNVMGLPTALVYKTLMEFANS